MKLIAFVERIVSKVFNRLNPPDKYQTQVMAAQRARFFTWSYQLAVLERLLQISETVKCIAHWT